MSGWYILHNHILRNYQDWLSRMKKYRELHFHRYEFLGNDQMIWPIIVSSLLVVLLCSRGSSDSVETTRWPLFLGAPLGSSKGPPEAAGGACIWGLWCGCIRLDRTLDVGEVTTDEIAELSAENLVGVWLQKERKNINSF